MYLLTKFTYKKINRTYLSDMSGFQKREIRFQNSIGFDREEKEQGTSL